MLKLLIICSALVQPVEPDDVLLAHLSSPAELNAGIRDGHQGGLVVLRESVPDTAKSKTLLSLDKRRWAKQKNAKKKTPKNE